MWMAPIPASSTVSKKCRPVRITRPILRSRFDDINASADLDGSKSYVDLFLIHSPHSGSSARKTMWQALERAHKEGRCKAIGVSNFSKSHIEEMKSYASVWPPMVNQIEVSRRSGRGTGVRFHVLLTSNPAPPFCSTTFCRVLLLLSLPTNGRIGI